MCTGRSPCRGEYAFDFVDSPQRLDSFRPGLPRVPASRDATFHGGYVEASYFVTGNAVRNYSGSSGRFNRPLFADGFAITDGGYGAVELAARVDYLNLNDGALRGGESLSFGVGANWWLQNNVKVVFNYHHIEVDDADDVFAREEGLPADNRVDVFLARAQVDF